jgi:hypothetical protein
MRYKVWWYFFEFYAMPMVCRYCGHNFRIPRKQGGTRVRCPICKKPFLARKPQNYTGFLVAFFIAIIMLVFIIISIYAAVNKSEKPEVDEAFEFKKKNDQEKLPDGYLENEKKNIKSDVVIIKYKEYDKAYSEQYKKQGIKFGELMPKHVGRTIWWYGEIVEIGTKGIKEPVYIKFRHNPNSKSDVIVYLNDSQIEEVMKYSPGQYIRYSGIIVEFGYGDHDHVLKSGRIIETDPDGINR